MSSLNRISPEEDDYNDINVPSLPSSPEIDSFVIIKSFANRDDDSECSDTEFLLPDISLQPEQKRTLTEELEKLDDINKEQNNKLCKSTENAQIDEIKPENSIPGSLQSSVRSTDHFSEEIQTKLAQLMRENATLKDTVLQNNENLRVHYERVAAWQNEVEIIEQRNKETLLQEKRVITQLKEENKALKFQNAELMENNKTEDTNPINFKSSDDHFAQELRMRLEQLKKENETLKDIEKCNIDALLEENRIIIQLNEENKALKYKNSEIMEDYTQKCIELENLTKSCATLETELNEANREGKLCKENLQAFFEENVQQIDILNKNLLKCETECVKLKEELAQQIGVNEQITKTFKTELTRQEQLYEDDFSVFTEKLMKSEKECKRLTEELTQEKRVISQLKEENTKFTENSSEQHNSELKNLTKTCATLKTALNEEKKLYQDDFYIFKEKLMKSETEREKLTKELAQQENVIFQLNKYKQEQREFELLTKTMNTELNREMKLYEDNLLVFKEKFIESEMERDKLVEELAEKKRVISQLKEENAAFTQKSAQQFRELENLTETCATLKTALNEEKKLYQDNLFILKENMAKSETKCVKLTQRLADLKVNYPESNYQAQQMPNQQIRIYQQSIERLQEDYFKLREQLEHSQKSLTACEQKRAVISAQFTVLQETNRQLEIQLETASQCETDQFVALKAQLETYKSDFEAEHEIKENLRREFNKMADDFQHVHQRNQQLQEEVGVLRNRRQSGGRNSAESTTSSARSNSPIPTTFACPICNEKFRSYKMIQEHLDTCIGINPDQ